MYRTNLIALIPATIVYLATIGGCGSLYPPESSNASGPVSPADRVAIVSNEEPVAEGSRPSPPNPTTTDPSVMTEAEPAADIAMALPNPMGRSQPRRSRFKGRMGSGMMDGYGGSRSGRDEYDSERYASIGENDFIAVADDPRSTFSIDVDTASYSNMRRFLREGMMPPIDAIRIEELINYFHYDYRPPNGPAPFSMTAEVGPCPWDESHRLVHIGLQGQVIDQHEVPPRNLVFLFDVSGSMNDPDKLPLLRRAFSLLADQLRPQDRVSIVVYAGASGVVLEPTSGANRGTILAALERLSAGGSTNGGAGIHSAYAMAQRGFIERGINRVILATDGDFNVGTTSEGDLLRLIEQKRQSGVSLSVLGFGRGNINDATMEMLADKGNGNYAYIDTIGEARKVLVEQAGATLVTIAKDVKLQVEFNPAQVARYRLVGYENRKLAHADFNDDTKDAGEIGAGHSVTALYEIESAHSPSPSTIDPLRYQSPTTLSATAYDDELLTVNIRYKDPNGHTSRRLSFPVDDVGRTLADTSQDFRFSAAVAGFGMLMRQSKYRGNASFESIDTLAQSALGRDPHRRRAEFITLVDAAARLSRNEPVHGRRIND